MKTNNRKILSILLALLLITSSFSGLVFEAYAGQLSLNSAKTLTGDQAADICSVAQANVSRTGRQVGATQHWCVDFVSSCARKAKIGTDIIPEGGNVSSFKSALLATGAKKVSSPQAGDLVFYGPSHVGIMAGSLYSYQGNFSGTGSGSTFWNSSKVLYCKYTSCSNYKTYGATFIRPKYKKAANILTLKYCAGGAETSDKYTLSDDVICKADGTVFTEKWTYDKAMKNGLYDYTYFGLEKEGFHFTGWQNSSGKIFDQSDESLLPSSIEPTLKTKSCTAKITAVWEENTLSVSYNANGGKLSSSDYSLEKSTGNILSKGKSYVQSWVYNETKTGGLVNASAFGLKRSGFKFKGWSTEKDGKKVFSQSDATLRPTDICADITGGDAEVILYAVWEKDHDHIAKTDKAVKATCTKEGLTEGSHCSECGFIMTEQQVVPAKGHSFEKEAVIDKEATCSKSGSSSRHCKRCSEVTDVTVIPALKHTYEGDALTPATLEKDGSVSGQCKTCGSTKKKETIAKIDSVSLSADSFSYTGKVQKPTVTVKDSKGKVLTKGTDYTVKYYTTDSSAPGKYYVKVTFKGNYSGSKKLSYKILPSQVTGVIVSSDVSKQIRIRYSATPGVTGYVIYRSTSQYGTYKKVCTTKNTSYTFKKLTSGKTYYFKVKAYKTVSDKNIYGEFSKTYCAKTK